MYWSSLHRDKLEGRIDNIFQSRTSFWSVDNPSAPLGSVDNEFRCKDRDFNLVESGMLSHKSRSDAKPHTSVLNSGNRHLPPPALFFPLWCSQCIASLKAKTGLRETSKCWMEVLTRTESGSSRNWFACVRFSDSHRSMRTQHGLQILDGQHTIHAPAG